MNKKRPIYIMAVILLLATAFGLTSCGQNAPAKATVLYHCPMHPQIVSDHPGKCPICGMDLVVFHPQEDKAPAVDNEQDHTNPAHKEENMVMNEAPSGYATITLNSEKQQLIGVQTVPVITEALTYALRVWGEVAHDPEMYQAQVEYLKTAGYGGGLASASKIKLEHMGMSQAQIRALERSGRAKLNLIVDSQDPLFWIYAYFYEPDLPQVKINQPVTITIPSMDHKVMQGTLKGLQPYIDTKSRTDRGIVEVRDKSLSLKPGLFVNASANVQLAPALVIPNSSIIDTGERQIVFVKKGAGTFEARQVRVGKSNGTLTQVISGLTSGEQVVVSGNFMLDSESKIEATMKKGMTGGHHH